MPEAFARRLARAFRLVAKPQPGWRGFVECEITGSCSHPAFSKPTRGTGTTRGNTDLTVRYTLEPIATGTRLIFEHTGFTGVGGFLLAKLALGPGWKKMMDKRMGELLTALRDDGTLEPNAALEPKFGEAVDAA